MKSSKDKRRRGIYVLPNIFTSLNIFCGFYAVIAGFAQPESAAPFDRHDPRHPQTADAFSSPAALRERLQAEGARFIVVDRDHAGPARAVGTVQAENRRFLLLRVNR